MLVRPEHSNEFIAIGEVLRSVFPTDQEAQLVEQLRQHSRLVVSLVAELEGQIVGHIAFSFVQIAGLLNGPVGAGLAPLAVSPVMQSRGVGARLVREGLFACERKGIGFVVVLGEPGYYKRFGFKQANRFGVENECGATDAFMISELKTGSIRAGRILYAPEFAELTV
ncbi:MAG: GNAT family N-acetyltransferase [Deltaproteobacteria bacterium]|nr:GNAT family N-acetyltransferase [Deltaproteobacteria bacterium]